MNSQQSVRAAARWAAIDGGPDDPSWDGIAARAGITLDPASDTPEAPHGDLEVQVAKSWPATGGCRACGGSGSVIGRMSGALRRCDVCEGRGTIASTGKEQR